jgi:hypothetical protein
LGRSAEPRPGESSATYETLLSLHLASRLTF